MTLLGHQDRLVTANSAQLTTSGELSFSTDEETEGKREELLPKATPLVKCTGVRTQGIWLQSLCFEHHPDGEEK